MLDGAYDGVKYYMVPNFERLKDTKVSTAIADTTAKLENSNHKQYCYIDNVLIVVLKPFKECQTHALVVKTPPELTAYAVKTFEQ